MDKSNAEAQIQLALLAQWVRKIRSGYPSRDGEPVGQGGRAFEQCRRHVLSLIDEVPRARAQGIEPDDPTG